MLVPNPLNDLLAEMDASYSAWHYHLNVAGLGTFPQAELLILILVPAACAAVVAAAVAEAVTSMAMLMCRHPFL